MSGIDAQRIMDRCAQLAQCSEQSDGLTRIFLSPEMRAAYDLVAGWMREAGMNVRYDAIGNLIGRYEGIAPNAPCLLLGSHLDTVRNGGRYDGMLGVITPIDCVQALADAGRRLPHAIEIVGFCDEEGVRFGTTLLGSKAIAGTFNPKVLDALDRDGVTMRDAITRFGFDSSRISAAAFAKAAVLAYIELHIEQGPVLEAEGLPVGVVTAINGFSRLRVTLSGVAGHAGTVPMNLRTDALAAAAECVLAVERIAGGDPDLVGTVGRLEVKPGAINVIPGEVMFTIDMRAPRNDLRRGAVDHAIREMRGLCERRGIEIGIEMLQMTDKAECAAWLMTQLDRAVAAEGITLRRLPSGAGHDGMAIQDLTDICMLFVRCEKGISHNPAEAITMADAGTSARVLARFIEGFQPRA